jgi:hypothetical protein
MSLIVLIAVVKAAFLWASWSKWRQSHRQKILMGSNGTAGRSIALVDRQLKRKVRSATKTQIFAASKLTQICRQAVQTQALEYVLLHAIQSGLRKRQSKLSITKPEVVP